MKENERKWKKMKENERKWKKIWRKNAKKMKAKNLTPLAKKQD